MRFSLIAICGVLLALGTSPGASQAAGGGQQARREALAVRYMRAVHSDTNLMTTLKKLTPDLAEDIAGKYPGLSASDRAKFGDMVATAVDQSLADIMPDYLDRASKILAKTYTADELEGMTAFYESPAGQAMVAKTPQISASMSELIKAEIGGLEPFIERHLCEKYTCDAPAKPRRRRKE